MDAPVQEIFPTEPYPKPLFLPLYRPLYICALGATVADLNQPPNTLPKTFKTQKNGEPSEWNWRGFDRR